MQEREASEASKLAIRIPPELLSTVEPISCFTPQAVPEQDRMLYRTYYYYVCVHGSTYIVRYILHLHPTRKGEEPL